MKKFFQNKYVKIISAILLLALYGAVKVWRMESRASRQHDYQLKKDISDSVNDHMKDFKLPYQGGNKTPE